MAKRYVFRLHWGSDFLSSFAVWLAAQDSSQDNGGNVIRVVVSMVQLNVAVTDEKGNYVTTLRPSDFDISEDAIPQKLATFEEGNEGPQNLLEAAQDPGQSKGSGRRRGGRASAKRSSARRHANGFHRGNRLGGQRLQRFHLI